MVRDKEEGRTEHSAYGKRKGGQGIAVDGECKANGFEAEEQREQRATQREQ